MAVTKPRDRETLLISLVNAMADKPRASMGQLATMIGLSRATLCRHFSSRDIMMQAMAEASVASAEQAFARARLNEGSAKEAVTRLIEEFLPIAELYTYVHQQMKNDEAAEVRAQSLRTSLISQIQQWQGSGELRVDLSAAWLVESMICLLSNAGAMIRSGRLARHDAPQSVLNLLWHGMSK